MSRTPQKPAGKAADKAAQKPARKKKEKITYIDDGSTVADMSGLGRRAGTGEGRQNPNLPPPGKRGKPAPTTRAGRIWRTYWDAVRMMVGPMLVVIGGISVVFFLIWVILGFFA